MTDQYGYREETEEIDPETWEAMQAYAKRALDQEQSDEATREFLEDLLEATEELESHLDRPISDGELLALANAGASNEQVFANPVEAYGQLSENGAMPAVDMSSPEDRTDLTASVMRDAADEGGEENEPGTQG